MPQRNEGSLPTPTVADCACDAPILVVGVGASAGGLEALEQFFDHMPDDCGFAFVVVQHLSPDFESLMDQLLARRTRMAVHRVENGMRVIANAIYLIPPGKEMIISDGKLMLKDKDPSEKPSLPIDAFLRSLANDCGRSAAAVILSGSGSDGSRGVKAIREAGGVVIAQEPASARFDSMPVTAIETEAVNHIEHPQRMADILLRRGREVSSPGEVGEADHSNLQQIFSLLQKEYGIDFSNYKSATIGRRIERRMQISHSDDLDSYVARVADDVEELDALYRDLLIGVTRFFRDAKAFEAIRQEVIPKLVRRANDGDEIRIWSAGCATGEEPYTLAILLDEALKAAEVKAQVKVFATDAHRSSLAAASLGAYPKEALSEVSPDRMREYFVSSGDGYQVSSELRKMIVFAPHNVLKDAPFTKLDFIVCRNLLIYFKPEAQRRVLSLFHFGLKRDGYLLLGPSESPGALTDEFAVVDRHWKIYRKRRDVRLASPLRLPTGRQLQRGPGVPIEPSYGTAVRSDNGLLRAYDSILELHAPPSILVDENRNIVHVFAGAGRYLLSRDGRPSLDVLENVSDDLKLVLAGALQRLKRESGPIVFPNISVDSQQSGERARVVVRDLHLKGDRFSLISIQAEATSGGNDKPKPDSSLTEASRQHMVSLEEELQFTKENLQSTVEELETSNEELQAANEELVASNEELQSTNEELHSVNEELYTVNAEYRRKIDELTQLNNDVDNLLRSTELGAIFLDQDLCIRKFTPQAKMVFELLPGDTGRRIDSFAHRVDCEGLQQDLEAVLQNGEMVERHVTARDGASLLLRVLPYRVQDAVEGVVLTFTDISSLREAEKERRFLSTVFRDAADPIIIEDLSGVILDMNVETERLFGWTRDELIGRNISVLMPDDMRERSAKLREKCIESQHVRNVEMRRLNKAGETTPVLLTLSLLTDDLGQPVAIASIAKDIRRRVDAENRAHDAVRRRDQFLTMLSHELRNPLNAVLGAARILRFEQTPPDVSNRARDVVERQSRHVARLLDDLLDVSRFAHGKINIKKLPLDLRALVREAVALAENSMVARQHDLLAQVPDEPVVVHADSARLLQIIDNLVSNAAKYTLPGGKVRVALTVEDGQAKLSVKDNGVGLSEDMLESVFELFVQHDESLDRSAGGMGLGLTLVRKLVELHGGSVKAYSEGEGQGSEFVVRLPLADEAPVEEESMEFSKVRSLRVAIVEDNADNREMLRSFLELEGYDVTSADDGVSGLATIAAQQPHVAVVDVGLPGMNGFQLAKAVRSQPELNNTLLIALTGYGRSEDRKRLLEAGFDRHLVKPLDPDILLQVIAERVVADDSQAAESPLSRQSPPAADNSRSPGRAS